MKSKKILVNLLIAAIVLNLVGIVGGLASFNLNHSFDFVNQYGETIKMWGYGLYKSDSYFKAPIFIGSDFTMLIVAIPLLLLAIYRFKKHGSQKNLVLLMAATATLLYYNFSQAFGVTYNQLHLLYIATLSLTFYSLILCFTLIEPEKAAASLSEFPLTKTLKCFLVIAGLSLFIAWLPDIVASLVSGKPLSMLQVYTTELTYVLDVGIVSPFIFITLFLLVRSNSWGYVLLPILLVLCSIVGIMVIFQSIFQVLAGISVPIPALLTKVLIFVLLSGVSFNLSRSYFRGFNEGTLLD